MKLNLSFLMLWLFSLAFLGNIKASNIPLDSFKTNSIMPKNFSGQLSPETLRKILKGGVLKVFSQNRSTYERSFPVSSNKVYTYISRSLHEPSQIPMNPLITRVGSLEKDPARKVWTYQLTNRENTNNENSACFVFSISCSDIKKASSMKTGIALETRKHFNRSFNHYQREAFGEGRPPSGSPENENYFKNLHLLVKVDEVLQPGVMGKKLKKSISYYAKNENRIRSSSLSPRKSRASGAKELRKSTSFYKKNKVSSEVESTSPPPTQKKLAKEIKKKVKKAKKVRKARD